MSAEVYHDALLKLLHEIRETQLDTVKEIGSVIGRSVAGDGVVHLFGSGHSHMAAEEFFARAGMLTTVRAIWPQQITDKLERVEGLGASILEMGDVRPGEVLFVISNSGINPMPIDVALEGKKRGAITVGVGSRAHSMAAPSRHSSGKRLLDVCDYFLDTRVPAGDALLHLDSPKIAFGPASTLGALTLIHMAMAEAIDWMVQEGIEPPVRMSRNLPGGDAHNDRLAERYRSRIPELG